MIRTLVRDRGRSDSFNAGTQGNAGTQNEQSFNGLYSVDLTARNTRRVPTPRDATNPTWGPLLK